MPMRLRGARSPLRRTARPPSSLRARVARVSLGRRCRWRGPPRFRRAGALAPRRRRRLRRASRRCPSRPAPAAEGRRSRGRRARCASATPPPTRTAM
eukprot:391480-Pleurochrysis_carterae.AAC.1